MTPEHNFITRCKVPGCNKEFSAPSLGIQIISKNPIERATVYVSKLAEHIQKKHSELAPPCMQGMMNMFGWLAVQHFDIEDPALVSMLDQTRRSLHVVTRGKWVDDATILDRAARLGLDQEKQSEVVTMLTELRDFLCEVEEPVPSALVTPNGSTARA
jgi:hypothetical protein